MSAQIIFLRVKAYLACFDYRVAQIPDAATRAAGIEAEIVFFHQWRKKPTIPASELDEIIRELSKRLVEARDQAKAAA
ncbi:MAG: hypothetical protein WB816_11985 [Methylocystis sp.]